MIRDYGMLRFRMMYNMKLPPKWEEPFSWLNNLGMNRTLYRWWFKLTLRPTLWKHMETSKGKDKNSWVNDSVLFENS